MSINCPAPSEDGRAWIEIDLSALGRNVSELRRRLPDSCELMAVVKADAYGHGAVRVSEHLRRLGVSAFAVATAPEGMRLRESGLTGEILVLGWTNPKDAHLLSRYDLTQMIVDAPHAKALSETGQRLRVHIAVDTGMHRLGIESVSDLENVYNCENLTVEGVASHLASSDSLGEDDVRFTRYQIDRFFNTAAALREKGFDTGKLHIQASYGIYNYPDLSCDYARAGIALYGVMSHNEQTLVKPELRPVLSLRARVAEVRRIAAGESVSYGRSFTADAPLLLATVCIGYADGVPRQLSGKGGECILRGKRVPIIGRICMDLLMLDVTAVPEAAPGDIVTLIGADGAESIRCEDFAERCGTITNDILCRLGARLPRIYRDEGS